MPQVISLNQDELQYS